MTEALIDKNLTRVDELAKLFTGSEGYPLTDEQTKQLNQILLQISLARRFNDEEAPAQTILEQVKNREISFTLSNEEKTGLTPEQIEQKRQTQIDQICAMVEVVEIARTTENPEVFKAIMKQECFSSIFDIISAITENKEANLDILYNCVKAIEKIAKNPNVAKDKDILSCCVCLIGNIAKIFTDDDKKMEFIKLIFEISKNPKADVYFLVTCQRVIENIAETFTNMDKVIEAIKLIFEITKNEKAC